MTGVICPIPFLIPIIRIIIVITITIIIITIVIIIIIIKIIINTCLHAREGGGIVRFKLFQSCMVHDHIHYEAHKRVSIVAQVQQRIITTSQA